MKSDFDVLHEKGLIWQDFCIKNLARFGRYIQCYSSKKYQQEIGEGPSQCEFKSDIRCTEFRSLSIQVGHRNYRGDAVQSGILRNDNAIYYFQGNEDIIFEFVKEALKDYYFQTKPKLHIRSGNGMRVFIMPFDIAKKLAVRYYDFNNIFNDEIKQNELF